MMTGKNLVLDLAEQMNVIGLPLMALKLDEIYRSPDFSRLDKLDLISLLIKPEYEDKVSKRVNNRLRSAHLIGTPCDIASCVDSRERCYEPKDVVKQLSTLDFIEDGLNVCILGPSDSGKTYLAKSLGTAACEKYKVSYNHCNELLESLVALKSLDYLKYQKAIKRIMSAQLLILDDFLLNTITDEREVKILLEIMDKRVEQLRSTLVCSQREPESWKAMLLNDQVSANAITKRATKHFTVVIQPKDL